MATIYKITATSVYIRSEPGVYTDQKGFLYNGGKLTVTEEKSLNDGSIWVHHSAGWSCRKLSNGEITMQVATAEDIKKFNNANKKLATAADSEKYAAEANSFISDMKQNFGLNLDTNAGEFKSYSENLLDNLRVNNTTGIHGVPYQFMDIADRRLIDGSQQSLGRKYAERIIKDIPLLMMIPGTPKFLGSKSFKLKKGILGRIVGGVFDNVGIDELDKNLTGTTKFYTLEPQYVDYFHYVNPMCRVAARLLEIHKYVYDGQTLDNYDWAKFNNDKIHKLFSHYSDCIPFYIHSDSQISESFSNGTTTSRLASSINGASDEAREIGFLLGVAGTKVGYELNEFLNFDNLEKTQQDIDDLVDKSLFKNSAIGSLAKSVLGSASVVASGARLIFPEIWSDSQFGRSYNINIRLVSPDCDKLSWYFNIWVPLAHILAFSCPRGVDNTEAYGSPFIVRGIYKGMFNCNMGIVTDLSVTRGQECCWTREGLPTVVEVSLSLKDLYSSMAVSSQNQILSNLTQLDYVGQMCGIDINEPDIKRQWDMFVVNAVENRVKDFWTNIPQSISHVINNKVTDMMSGFLMG